VSFVINDASTSLSTRVISFLSMMFL